MFLQIYKMLTNFDSDSLICDSTLFPGKNSPILIVFFLKRGKKKEPWFWHIWIAQWLKFFPYYSLSFSISVIFREKRVIKVGPKTKALGSSLFPENSNPLNFFQTMLLFARVLLLVRILAILHHIWGSKGPKTSQKRPWYAKLWKLLT